MRETRLSGLEGGVASNAIPTPIPPSLKQYPKNNSLDSTVLPHLDSRLC